MPNLPRMLILSPSFLSYSTKNTVASVSKSPGSAANPALTEFSDDEAVLAEGLPTKSVTVIHTSKPNKTIPIFFMFCPPLVSDIQGCHSLQAGRYKPKLSIISIAQFRWKRNPVLWYSTDVSPRWHRPGREGCRIFAEFYDGQSKKGP